MEGHGKRQRIYDVVPGRLDGRDYWAFVTPVSGTRSASWRIVVALPTAHALPQARIEPQNRNDALELAVLRRLFAPARRRGVAEAERISGPQIDPKFDQHFRIHARDVHAVRAFLTPALQEALLAGKDIAIALESTDILCWRAGSRPKQLTATQIEPLLHVATTAHASLPALLE